MRSPITYKANYTQKSRKLPYAIENQQQSKPEHINFSIIQARKKGCQYFLIYVRFLLKTLILEQQQTQRIEERKNETSIPRRTAKKGGIYAN